MLFPTTILIFRETKGAADSYKIGTIKTTPAVTSFEECIQEDCERSQQRAMLAKGPLAVYIDGDGNSAGNSMFQHYKSGVIEMPCVKINHVVVLLGIDNDEQGNTSSEPIPGDPPGVKTDTFAYDPDLPIKLALWKTSPFYILCRKTRLPFLLLLNLPASRFTANAISKDKLKRSVVILLLSQTSRRCLDTTLENSNL